ncbi:LptA/OstA family protein [Deinococcus antarcticus]|uniref:LptA/OstA family protein n=1 Tax=Deinococcus antarcticus TaxID=1298767 RepID=A0ABV8A677_9DEIO
MNLKKSILIVAALASVPVLAQTASKRVIKIESSPAPGSNLRDGPWNFTGGVTATVSSLKIKSDKGVMTAPAGTPILQAEGKRLADFSGNVTVTRGRLTAKGEKLAYSEVTGQGVMTGNPSATFVPEKKDDGDPVNIRAQQMSLDVDTNVSTSTGNVQLVQGNQTGKAEKLIFDEDKELALMTGTPTLTRAAKGNRKELVISGDEVRAITKTKVLYVKGKVKLVQGTQTTTGNAVYYDDKKDVAYVVGDAVSVDSKSKVTLRAPASGYLEQRTDLGRVSVKNGKYTIPVEQFKLSQEK